MQIFKKIEIAGHYIHMPFLVEDLPGSEAVTMTFWRQFHKLASSKNNFCHSLRECTQKGNESGLIEHHVMSFNKWSSYTQEM